ncbi:MarR family winged helix-turn-helix transcriptional regulator [Clostridium massiliamazoniense]|uniref:MarR family winged helix-turn-helix transcriptional regulator n=1 Tax=Clostridium massiliamazoniense TaxID=1347366 RepID=UPI0006D840B0|nr:MarR family transcriptional regulator [Clostridium massiliamazoniense]
MKYIVEETTFYALNRLIVKIKKNMAKQIKPYDVTLEQWSLLTRLWKDDGISQTELAIRTNKDLPTVTRTLVKLREKGLIEKKENPNDSRAYLVYLTEEGKKLEKPLDTIAQEVENKILESLTPSEVVTFKKIMNSISNNFDN